MSVLCCVRSFIWLVQPNKPDCFVISMLPQSLLPKLRYACSFVFFNQMNSYILNIMMCYCLPKQYFKYKILKSLQMCEDKKTSDILEKVFH